MFTSLPLDNNSSKREIYHICQSWPYVNYELHAGHIAGNYLSGDIFARFQRQRGNLVLMVSGSDCHGTPIINAAIKENLTYQEIVDKYHKAQIELFHRLNISFDNYTRTATDNHKEIAQDIFKTLYEKGYMQEKTVEQLYDEKVGRFLADRYVDGECPNCGFKEARGDQCDNCGKTLEPTDLINPVSKLTGTTPVLKEATHLYLDLGKFADQLEKWIEGQSHWRANVRNFALGWIREGLKETPITRDLDWGVPVPIKGYETKVMYVWIEAVMGYLTAAVEWAKLNAGTLTYDNIEQTNIFTPSDDNELKAKGENAWEVFWKNPDAKSYYFVGKDNIPFHTIHWPALILGYGKDLNLPYDVPANQYLNLTGGQKMSKSRGTFITARELLDKYSVDTIRYYFAKILPEFSDSEFDWNAFHEANNADLVGKLGNFVNRVYVFTEKNFGTSIPSGQLDKVVEQEINNAFEEADSLISEVKLSQGIARIFKLVQYANQYFDAEKPWETVKGDKAKAANTLYNCFQLIAAFATLLYPYIPDTAEKVAGSLGFEVAINGRRFGQVPTNTPFSKLDLLFQKIEKEDAEE